MLGLYWEAANMNKKLLEFIFFIILIIVMVMSLNMAVADSTAMNIKTMEMLKYTFIVVVVAATLIRLPITLLAAAVVLVGGSTYAYVNKLVIPVDVMNYFGGFFRWLTQYVIGYEAFKPEYSLVFAVLYIILVTLIITLLVFSKKGYGLLIALGTGAFAFFWFIYVSNARLYLFYYLFAALILYSYNVYNRKKLEWVNAESKIDKFIEIKWIFNSLIIVIISIGISQFAVIDIKPVQWAWLSDRAVKVFPFIENWRNDSFDNFSFGFGSKYSIDSVGYKTKRLGGPVKLSEKVMLIVETTDTDDLYLRGAVKDYYTGSSWKKIKKSSTEYNTDSSLPMPWASNSTYSKEISIVHQGLITSTIFAPNTLYRVENKLNKFLVDQDGEAVFSRAIGKNDKYVVKSEIPYIEISQIRRFKTGYMLETYKQLPDNISARVKQLALDITKDYKSDYDKAKAIEKYLRTNYKYTLSPSEVPVGSEFVDYFLFEGKEGYCTYFATSMAVLLRAADIPCRYVEGFLAKYNNSTVRNVPGTDAHAWVEIDYGIYGWLTFEATPAYPLQGYRTKGEVPAAPIPVPDVNGTNTPTSPVGPTTGDRDQEVDEEQGTGADAQTKEVSLATRIILAVIAILLLRVAYLLLKRAYIELKLKKSTGKQYAIQYFQEILRYLKKINVKMDHEETMREYWYKVKYALDEDYKDGDQIVRLLEKLRYSNDQIEEKDKIQLEEYRKMVKHFVTARLGTIKSLVIYYIIGL
jgi:transglutaminase-like putative cysteine protease